MVIVEIFNLDSTKLLHTLDLNLQAYEVTNEQPKFLYEKVSEEMAIKLSVPVENQVYFGVDDWKWDPFERSLTNTKKVILRLGCQPTQDTGDTLNEQHQLINGSYTKFKIFSKFSMCEVTDEFHSKLTSTLMDLELYLERKLKIPAGLLIVTNFGNNKWLTVKENKEQFLMAERFISDRLPNKNHVYIQIKELSPDIFIDYSNWGIKLKPVSIYTQLEPNNKTKLLTIQPEQNILTIAQVKHEIQTEFGIPIERQIIYQDAEACVLQDVNSCYVQCAKVYDKTLPLTIFNMGLGTNKNEIDLFLTVECGEKQDILEKCKELGIKVLEVVLTSPSGNQILRCPVDVDLSTLFSLKEIVNRLYEIPVESLCMYNENFRFISKDCNVWKYFGYMLINRTCKIYVSVFMQEKWVPIFRAVFKELEIPVMSPEIIIKSSEDREILKADIFKISKKQGLSWYDTITTEIEKKIRNLPENSLVLLLDGDVIPNKTHSISCFKELFFYKGIFRKEVVIIMTLNASKHKEIESNFHFPKRVIKLKFLTSESMIDLRKKYMEYVYEVKKYISEKKNAPVDIIDIFCDDKLLTDTGKIADLYRNGNSELLELNVVFQIASDIQIQLRCPYFGRFAFPVRDFTISGSQTVYDMRKRIAEIIGLPVSHFLLTYTDTPIHLIEKTQQDNGNAFIYDIVRENYGNSIKITVRKIVTLRISIQNSSKTFTYPIWSQNDTVRHLLKIYDLNIPFQQQYKLQKTAKVNNQTLLHELTSTDVIELKKKNKIPCVLM